MTGPVICAWCQGLIAPGDDAQPASHGICEPCDLRLQADLASVESHHAA